MDIDGSQGFQAPVEVVWRGVLPGNESGYLREHPHAADEVVDRFGQDGPTFAQNPTATFDSATGATSIDARCKVRSFWTTRRDSMGFSTIQMDALSRWIEFLRNASMSGGPGTGYRFHGVYRLKLSPVDLRALKPEHAEIYRDGAEFHFQQRVQGDHLEVTWDAGNPALQENQKVPESWGELADFASRYSSVQVMADHRSWFQKVVNALGMVNWLMLIYLVAALVGSWYGHRRLSRGNVKKPKGVYGAPRAAPGWWNLYPLTLTLGFAWILWGLRKELPIILASGWYIPESDPRSSVFAFVGCTTRLFAIPGLFLLWSLFRARRSSFPALNMIVLSVWGLWFNWEAFQLKGMEEIDAAQVWQVLALLALWQSWGWYFLRAWTPKTVFRVDFVKPVQPDEEEQF